MVEISYETVLDVTMTWDRLKLVKNYKEKTNELILSHMFGKAVRGPNPVGASASMAHFHYMAEVIECALALLGPDLEPLNQDLQRLGRRHRDYGVAPELFDAMSKAILSSLESFLDLSRRESKAWSILLDYVCQQMTVGLNGS